MLINPSLLAGLQKGQLGDTGSSTTGLTSSPQRQIQDVPMMHPRHPLHCSNLSLRFYFFRQVTPGSAHCHPAHHPCAWAAPSSCWHKPLGAQCDTGVFAKKKPSQCWEAGKKNCTFELWHFPWEFARAAGASLTLHPCCPADTPGCNILILFCFSPFRTQVL